MSSKKEKKSKEMLAVPKAPESVEILNLTITDLSRKLAQSNEKIKLLTKTNETLSQDLGTVSGDKDDIISYLKTVISTHEMTISNLEKKLSDSDQSQKDLVKTNEAQIKLINDAHTIQVEKVSMELQAARLELSDLSKFTLEKQELYTQLKTTKALLEKTEVEYRTTIHALERKITLDKSTLKKEMIMRLNESVASFRKVADSQMAETTKRALRENMSVTAQLRRMSDKVVQVVGENDALKRRVVHLKRKNELLAESEKILAAKSLSYQNTIKLIYQKLKESDQILELAFEENAAVYEQNADQILTEEMKREIADLQDDYNQLVERITAVNLLGLDIEFLVDEARDALQSSTEGEIVEYMEESLMVIVKKLAKFTNFDVPFPSTANLLEERDLGNEDDSNEYTSGKQEHYNQIIGQSQIIYTEIEPLPNYSGSSTTGTVSRASKNYSQNYSSHIAGSKFNSSSFQSDCLNNGQSFDERLEDKALSETEERASLCSTPSDTKIENELGPKKCQNLNPTKGNEDTVTITKSPRPSNFHKTTTINGDRKKDVGVQTNITEQNIDAEHLLKELREWDAKAVNQSRKYTPRKSGASKQQLKINHKQDLQKNVVKIKVGTNKL